MLAAWQQQQHLQIPSGGKISTTAQSIQNSLIENINMFWQERLVLLPKLHTKKNQTKDMTPYRENT
jgi:hypothetical protein